VLPARNVDQRKKKIANFRGQLKICLSVFDLFYFLPDLVENALDLGPVKA
jgi:hypothetical protein